MVIYSRKIKKTRLEDNRSGVHEGGEPHRLGDPSDAAWDREAESSSLIAPLKALYAKMTEVAENTAST
jgi:hypothetical protein